MRSAPIRGCRRPALLGRLVVRRAWVTYAAGGLDEVAGVVAIYGEAFSGAPTLYERFSAPLLLIVATEDTEPAPAALHVSRRERVVETEPIATGLTSEDLEDRSPRPR